MTSFAAYVLLVAAGLPLVAGARPADTAREAGVISESTVDRVWSGHPVSFAFLTDRGHQFVAYYDSERRITVASRRIDETEWKYFRPAGATSPNRGRASNVTGWDSHNYLALALDRDGCLHLSGNMHVDPLVYYRSTRPLDITSLERVDRMTGEREQHVTYPLFFKNQAGDLFFRYRDGGSGNGSDIYNVYQAESRSWINLLSTPLLDGQGRRNAYATSPVLGPDGRFHLVWMWRETPDCSTNHTLSYARSADFIHWEKSDGTPLSLPITLESGEVVDPSPVGQGLINMSFNVGFDARKRPVVVYHRYDAAGRSQAYAARPSSPAHGWDVVQISDWDFRWRFSGGGSIAAEVKLGAPALQPDGNLLVAFSTTHAARSGRWKLDSDTLRPAETLPAPAPILPASLSTPSSARMEVQTVISRHQGRRWVLRWETLPRNRDLPRAEAPPPSALRVYELPDADTGDAIRIGS